MVDITHKNSSLRSAIAECIVSVSKQETIDAIQKRLVPKGDVFEMAKTAGLFAVKKTSDMIPDCHPLPIEYTRVDYTIDGLSVQIRMEVKAIYRTGVEVEAMHGVSVVALTMYDMLKPIDKEVEIKNIRLVSKTGGKSALKKYTERGIKAAVVVCSDSITNGSKEDKSGKLIMSKLESYGVQVVDYLVIPDDTEKIQSILSGQVGSQTNLLVYTGGTGLSSRDFTPEALIPLLDRRIPGVEEAMRDYGQERTPLAMFSRSIAGVKGKTLVLALPGSTKGAEESMDAVFPNILHLFDVMENIRHD